MSYAGLYGPDETCPCGHYWRQCPKHSRRASAHNAERETAIEHVEKADDAGPTIEPVQVTFYDVTCEGCGGTWREETEEEAQARYEGHLTAPRNKAGWPKREDDGWRPFQSAT